MAEPVTIRRRLPSKGRTTDPKPIGRSLTKAPRTSTGSADLLRGIDPSKLNANGRALLASAIRENRPISANAVPGLGQAVRSLGGIGRGQSSVPRSARPIGPIAQAQAHVAALVNQSDVGRTLRGALGPGPSKRMGPKLQKGPFKPAVKLDRSQVRDTRGNTPTEKRASVPRREGASSSTSRGPSTMPTPSGKRFPVRKDQIARRRVS